MLFYLKTMAIFDSLIAFIEYLLSFLWKVKQLESNNKPQIFVKCGPETIIPVFLEENWTVHDLKAVIGSKLCLNSDELRIIFAGKDLDDEISIQDCDVGEQTVIHAVHRKNNRVTVNVEAKCPLNQVPFCKNDDDEEENRTNNVGSSKNSHFFVYCNSECKSLCPGKLRVCCSTCKEGTLIVNEDPTCWEDVLTPNKISGNCLAENCDGAIAEFYFKCAKHTTSTGERALPLNLVKNNFKQVPCIACTDISSTILVFPCTDGHVICLDCFCSYCFVRLDSRSFIQDHEIGYSIDCPAGCPESLIKDSHHFKLLGEEKYARYQYFGAEECLLQNGGVLCPQPNCGAGILPMDTDCQRIVCSEDVGGCGFVFCKQCMQGYHIGACEQLDEVGNVSERFHLGSDATHSTWDVESKQTIKITTKPCPKCRTPTERAGGCMHMVCSRPQCKFDWCWVCQEEWSRDCMGNHWFG